MKAATMMTIITTLLKLVLIKYVDSPKEKLTILSMIHSAQRRRVLSAIVSPAGLSNAPPLG
jgi:hypothetical protein